MGLLYPLWGSAVPPGPAGLGCIGRYMTCAIKEHTVSLNRDAGKPGMLRNGTEWNGTEPEVIDAQYGRRCWTRGQKLALIRTVCVCVLTLILHSVTATKTEQAPTESHVERINC